MIAILPGRLILLFFAVLWTFSMTARSETLMVWGDSLSAAYNIPVDQGWVSLLQQRLMQGEEKPWLVVNASVSGETSGGGLARLSDALMRDMPALLILGLGSNDGLQGMPLPQLKSNLKEMIEQAKGQGAQVLLLGNKIPPNYGAAYANGFEKVYLDIADEQAVPLVPFLLEGVATDFDLMQSDGLHPTSDAQTLILETVWPYLEPLL